MDKSSLLTAARLRELLHYSPESGVFTWIVRPSNNVHIGDTAGCRGSKGYLYITTNRRLYLAHRLAWLYMRGEWPTAQIDHVDGIRGNNRFSNLREATSSQNMQNQRRARINNRSVLLGVSRSGAKGPWIARICVDKEERFLGHFPTPELAHAAYLQAKRELHTHCTI